MAIRLRTTFDNLKGKHYSIQVRDSEYTGDDVYYVAGGDGFLLDYQTNGNDYLTTPIVASSVKLPIIVTDAIRADIVSLLEDIVSSDAKRFTVVILEDVGPGNELFWMGKLMVDRVKIPDRYFAEITLFASDGFGLLETTPYDDDGTLYPAEYATLHDHFNNIISKLDLIFNASDPNQPQLAYLMNWKYDGMAYPVQDNIQVHHDAFKEYKGDEIVAFDCLYVLKQLLIRFNCRIIQQAGIFYIQQYGFMAEDSNKIVYYYLYNGSFIGHSFSHFNTETVDKLAGGLTFYREPAKNATIEYRFKDGISYNMFGPRLLEIGTTYNLGFLPNDEGEQFAFGLDFMWHVIQQFVVNGSLRPYYIFDIHVLNTVTSETYYYVNHEGSNDLSGYFDPIWSTDGADRQYKMQLPTEMTFAETADYLQSVALLVPNCPIEGNLYFSFTVTFPVGLEPYASYTVVQNIASIIYGLNEPGSGLKTTIKLNLSGAGEEIKPDTLIIGDKPFSGSVGRLKFYDGLDWTNTDGEWGYEDPEGLDIDNLLGREIVALQLNAVKMMSLVLLSDVNVANKIQGKIITVASYVANQNQWSVECFEAVMDRSTIGYTTYFESNESTGIPGGITIPGPVAGQFWTRTGTVLTPTTPGDQVIIEINDNGEAALLAKNLNGKAIHAVSEGGGTAVTADAESGGGTGVNSQTTGSGIAVNAVSVDGAAVSAITSGSGVAVKGQSAGTTTAIEGMSETGWAVYGHNNSDEPAIVGYNPNGPGLQGLSSDSDAGFFQVFSTTGNSEKCVVKIKRVTNGTPAIGMGGSIDFDLQYTGSNSVVAKFISLLTDAGSTTFSADFVWHLRNAGSALAEVMRLTGPGELLNLKQHIGSLTTAPTSTHQITGSQSRSIVKITNNLTLTDTHYTVICDTTSTAIDVLLPDASTCYGRCYRIRRWTGTNDVTITPAGYNSIIGSVSSYALLLLENNGEWIEIQSNGIDWYIVQDNPIF